MKRKIGLGLLSILDLPRNTAYRIAYRSPNRFTLWVSNKMDVLYDTIGDAIVWGG